MFDDALSPTQEKQNSSCCLPLLLLLNRPLAAPGANTAVHQINDEHESIPP